MGTTVQSKSYLPGYCSMRDLNQDSNGCSWSLYYGDNTMRNGQYYNGFVPRASVEAYSGYDKDVVKQKMLEHEEIFKYQVCELHRLYRIQKDLMDEVKRKEQHKSRIAIETSFSSSLLASQITSEDARKWHIPGFPLGNSVCAGPSISGVEDIHSPLSSMKGSCTQAGHLPFQNGGSSKDVEFLESRPTKVRRKMIDLQLPADEYIDTEDGEQYRDETVSGSSTYHPKGNQKIASKIGDKLFVGEGERTGCQGDVSRSDPYLRSKTSLADLNEPIPVEETNTSGYFNLLDCASCDGEIKSHELSSKPISQLQALPKEFSMNSHHGSNNGTPTNRHLESNENGRSWFSHVIETGSGKSNLKPLSQVLEYEKAPMTSQSTQVLFDKAHEIPAFSLTDQSKVDPWRERTVRGLESSERNHSNNNLTEIGAASNLSSTYPAASSSSDLFNSWPHSVSSWEKSCSSLNHRSISVQSHPYLNSSGTLSRSPQTSGQTYGIFGDGWYLSGKPRPNSSVETELPNRNGFYYGSSSGSREHLVQAPSIGYNHVNHGHDSNAAAEQVINHGSAKLYKGSNDMDMKSAKDVNLNVVLSNGSLDAGLLQSIEVKDGVKKHEDHLAVLPWLRAKPCKNEATGSGRDLNVGKFGFLQSSLNQSVNKTETGNDQIFTQNLTSGSGSGSSNIEASKVERSDFLTSNRKILGFSLSERPHASKNESSCLTSVSVSTPPPSEVQAENNRNIRVLDINLPCDAAVPDLSQQIADDMVIIEKKLDVKVTSFRHHIDLNSCVSEDEASLMPTVLSTTVKPAGIDLEAPMVPETEEDVMHGEENLQKTEEALLQSPQHKTDRLQDELVRVAAEAILAISSSGPCDYLDAAACDSSKTSVKDPLNWFVEIVEVVSSCGDDLESKLDAFLRSKDGEDNDQSSSEEIDYFESMTLKLAETKEEDYMPKPLVPENFKVEETGTTLLPNRPRKGQARRGRQRRDFQRDILPGLASLSRHEVTEDLQTFGGLMRATGHSWHSGLTRRNSTRSACARGRRRSVVSPSPVVVANTCPPLMQQLTNIEVGLDDGSLTGWGKTTRRPRRQRCPAGNPPLPLT